MAIDTENERRSVAQVLPIPDGIIGASDFQHVARLFSGIITFISLSPDNQIYTVPSEDRVYLVGTEAELTTNITLEDRIYQVIT